MAKKRVKRKAKSSPKRKSGVKSNSRSYRVVNTKSSRVPGFVKAIALLYFLVAVFTILIGILLFLGGVFGSTIFSAVGVETLLQYSAERNQIDSLFVPIILGSLAVVGLLFIAFGILDIFVGRGLWKGRQWARVLTIIFMAIGLITSIFSFDFVTIVISALIGGYLLFSRKVKAAFR